MLRPSKLRCTLLSNAAPFWATLHHTELRLTLKWATRHPKKYNVPRGLVSSTVHPFHIRGLGPRGGADTFLLYVVSRFAMYSVHGIGAWELGKVAQGNLIYFSKYKTLIVRKHWKTLLLNIKPISEGITDNCFVLFRKVDGKWYR